MSGPSSGSADLSRLGQWVPCAPFTIERSRIMQYAAATNDLTPAHREGRAANPVFAVLPAWPTLFPLLRSTLVGRDTARALHGAHDITLHGPLTPGVDLVTRAAIVGAAPTSTGMTITGRATSEAADGGLLVDQYMTVIVQGLTIPEAVGYGAPPVRARRSRCSRSPDRWGPAPSTRTRRSAMRGPRGTARRSTSTPSSLGRPGFRASSTTGTARSPWRRSTS